MQGSSVPVAEREAVEAAEEEAWASLSGPPSTMAPCRRCCTTCLIASVSDSRLAPADSTVRTGHKVSWGVEEGEGEEGADHQRQLQRP